MRTIVVKFVVLQKSKFYNGKYAHTISGGENYTRTHTQEACYRKYSTVPLRMSFEGLRQENPRVFRVMLPLIFPGVLIMGYGKAAAQRAGACLGQMARNPLGEGRAAQSPRITRHPKTYKRNTKV